MRCRILFDLQQGEHDMTIGKRTLGGISRLVLVGFLCHGCVNRETGVDSEAVAFAVSGSGKPSLQKLEPTRHYLGHSFRGRHFFSEHGGKTGTVGGTCGKGTPAPKACTGTAPTVAAITGSASSPAGGTYTYAAAGLTAPQVTPITSSDGLLEGLEVAASPGVPTDVGDAWSGLGLFFDAPACVNASAYTGIKFTIAGDLGTCRLSVVGVPSEDSAVANNQGVTTVNTCTASSCVSPSFGPLTANGGPTIVHFADLSGGSPLATLDPKALIDVGWQLDAPVDGSPACTAAFTITDVSFVNDAPRPACTGTAPASSLITDFSDALTTGAGAFTIGEGGTFTYQSAGSAAPVLSLVSTDGTPAGQALSVSIDTGLPPANIGAAFSGFGLYFNSCTDASAYSGISFMITGDLGACPLQFSAQFSEDDFMGDDPSFGSCSAALCYSPSFQPVGLGTNTISFASMTGGAPVTVVDAARLTGVHWQVTPPTGASAASCAANFTVDDVAFVP
jgi:hypothetical protein